MMTINETKNYLNCLKSRSGLSNDDLIKMIDKYNKCLARDKTDDADEWGFVNGNIGNFSGIIDRTYTILVLNKHIFCCNTESCSLTNYQYLMENIHVSNFFPHGIIMKSFKNNEDKRYNDLVKLECFLYTELALTHNKLEYVKFGRDVGVEEEVYNKLCDKYNVEYRDWCWTRAYGTDDNYTPPNKSIFKTKVSLSTKIFN